MADYHPALAVFTTAFGLPATVLPAVGGPIASTVIWDAYRPAVEASALVVEFESEWATFRRDEVADIQPGETFTASRVLGALPTTFRVVRIDRSDPEMLHVAVHGTA